VKFAEPRPYADPEVAMRKLLEIASTVEPFKMVVFTSRRSTGRFYSSTTASRPNSRHRGATADSHAPSSISRGLDDSQKPASRARVLSLQGLGRTDAAERPTFRVGRVGVRATLGSATALPRSAPSHSSGAGIYRPLGVRIYALGYS
jgi:hypothetical protein